MVKELVRLLEQSVSLLRQDLVALKNEFMLLRIEFERYKTKDAAKTAQEEKSAKYILGILAFAGVIGAAIIGLWRK